ncbi:pullulanase X25 domain-containing protein, partial [Oscillospiraceae bacterium LCP25S3_E4]
MTKIKVNKALHASLSALLVLVLLVTSLPLTSMNTSAETVSQTKYENITDFQNARWTEIQNEVFGKNNTEVQSAKTIYDDGWTVNNGNKYFNWTDTSKMQGYNEDGTKRDGGLIPYGTTTVTDVPSRTEDVRYANTYIDYNGQKQTMLTNKIKFLCYDVYTADQFTYVLMQIVSRWWAKEYVKINICADIDMGGSDGKMFTTGRALYSRLHIEGNGHTIYNWKMYGRNRYFGLFCTDQYDKNNSVYGASIFVVKNLGIQSAMMLHQNAKVDEEDTGTELDSSDSGAGFFLGGGFGCGSIVFDNVHMREMYFQQNNKVEQASQGIAFFAGRGKYRCVLMNNCSTSDGYIYGQGHVGGMFSYVGLNQYKVNTCSVKYDAEYPECAEAACYVANPYPMFFNNSYSVDCEMFSTLEDSGAFISCGNDILAVNCYTNNTIYSNSNTGGFIGRVGRTEGSKSPAMYDDNGQAKISGCFRNCYSSGIVEGKLAMGGFVGLDNGFRLSSHTWSSDGANTANAATIYSNCYSTAMVGMDYTGKYCGGFIGFDDNQNAFDNGDGITVTASDGKVINALGAIYMNCYAAGEVGNILTVTENDKAAEYEKSFFDDNYYNSADNMSDPLYYPSGGFVGVVSLDFYYRSKVKSGFKIYGYFYNCYYDMQTTGMREMAIGLAYAETCRDDPTGNNKRQGFSDDTKVVHKDAEGNEMPFSVIGITGVYTEKSDVKNVAGLTGSPVEYKDGSGNVLSRMSMSGEGAAKEDDSNWQYNDGYYPQLKTFMSSDTTVGNINDTQVSDVTNDVKSSVFYVGEAEEVTETKEDGNVYITKLATHPVMSLANSKEKIYENYQPNTNVYAAELASVLIPYRYSQASTATVKLSHWDYKMNTTDGSLSTDNDWACGVASNQLKLNSDTGYFENTYTGLSSGKYSFKVQANSSMTYNYGSNRFDGQNCELNIPVENCSARIMFKYNGLRSQDYQIYAVLANANGEPIDENGAKTVDQDGNPVEKKILLGGTATDVNPDVWTLVGTLPNSTWNVTDAKYDLKISPTNSSIYTYTCDFTPNKDESGNYVETECQFKIAKDHAWTESYGIAGKSDNMSFKYNQPCTVYFEFNTK